MLFVAKNANAVELGVKSKSEDEQKVLQRGGRMRNAVLLFGEAFCCVENTVDVCEVRSSNVGNPNYMQKTSKSHDIRDEY